jgi:xanthine dehydrogenase accessory factor
LALKTTYSDYVLEALLRWHREGRACALLTLIATTGSAPRPLGSQMAVCEDGRALGMITGGCAEAALITDAMEAIGRGRNQSDIYGEGSRFKDIVLPCGSGLEVYFDVTLSMAVVEALIAARQARRVCALSIDSEAHQCFAVDTLSLLPHRQSGSFIRPYRPEGRIVLVGQGPIMAHLAYLVRQAEMTPVIYSSDESVHAALGSEFECHNLIDPADVPAQALDGHEALVLLFHDHSFEVEILRRGLASQAFYITALGSIRTHERRLASLTETGVTASDLKRLKGPAGLDIAARTPPEIALSIMAELILHWRRGFQ